MAAPPRFESLPPEIRNIIYTHLLDPIRRTLRVRHWKLDFRSTDASCKTSIDILRTNRNINREASAVLYRDVVLVSIDWHAAERAYLGLYKGPQDVPFNFVHPDAPLPPCVVRIKQQYDGESGTADRMYTIVAAADFAAICRLLSDSYLLPQYDKCGASTSYSVISLPKIGYNVDRLRELIWSPLAALRDSPLKDYGDRIHRNLSFFDCTGVFEQTAAVSDWYSESNGEEDESDQGNESDDGASDDHVIEMDTSGEGDGDAEDIDERQSGKEENREDEGRRKEDSDDGCNNDEWESKLDDEEDGSDEALTNKHCSKDPGERMSNCASFTSCNKEKANSQTKSHSGFGGRCDDGNRHVEPNFG